MRVPRRIVEGMEKLKSICLDPNDLNRATKREYYPMPTIEEVSTRLKHRMQDC